MSAENLIPSTPDEERTVGVAADALLEVCRRISRAQPAPTTAPEHVEIAQRGEHAFLATLALVQATTNRAASLQEAGQYMFSMAQAVGNGIGSQIADESIAFLLDAVMSGLSEGVAEGLALAKQTVAH